MLQLVNLKKQETNMDLVELLAKLQREMQDIVAKETISPEDETRFADIETEIGAVKRKIEMAERAGAVADLAQRAEVIENTPIRASIKTNPALAPQAKAKEFETFDEYSRAVVEAHFDKLGRSDERLQYAEKRDQSFDIGVEGGFLVPQKFLSMMTPQNMGTYTIRQLATKIPSGNSASIEMPYLDQYGEQGRRAGTNAFWVDEGTPSSKTSTKFGTLKFEPRGMSAYFELTNKLMGNYGAITSMVQNLLVNDMSALEEQAFINGDGIGKPAGFMNAKCTLEVTRKTASEINYEDIINMYSKRLAGKRYVWLYNNTAIPQLMQLSDGAGQLIWQPSARDGVPSTLLGLPMIESEFFPNLGATGDLMLVDLSSYGIVDGLGMTLAVSRDVKFLERKSVILAYKEVDARSMFADKLKRDNGTYGSPFIALK